MQVYPIHNEMSFDSILSDCAMKEDAQSSYMPSRQRYIHYICFSSSYILRSSLVFCQSYFHSLLLSWFFLGKKFVMYAFHWSLFLYLSTVSIHHLHLAQHLILKHLHFKPIDTMFKMEIVLWIQHHVFLGKNVERFCATSFILRHCKLLKVETSLNLAVMKGM